MSYARGREKVKIEKSPLQKVVKTAKKKKGMLLLFVLTLSLSTSQPAMELTPLGKTVSAADQAWFRSAAQAVIQGGRFRAPRYNPSPVSSPPVSSPPTAECQFASGVGYPNETSGGVFPVFDAVDCCKLCQLDTACIAAAFVNTSANGGGNCKIATTLNNPGGEPIVGSIGCIVPPSPPSPSTACTFHPNMQLYDPTSKHTENPLPAADAAACCGVCQADRQCYGAELYGTSCYKKTANLPLVKQVPPPGVSLIACTKVKPNLPAAAAAAATTRAAAAATRAASSAAAAAVAANATAWYYSPDNSSDPRHHYGSQYVRDFTYTFTMAPDLVPASDIPNILDWLMSGQVATTGEMPEGGMPPKPPGMNCWDNGPFLAKAFASYALLYDDLDWFCGEHPAGGSRVSRLLAGIEFLNIPTEDGIPHLVTTGSPHCMYGFNDLEPKRGHVLFTSLLVVEGAALVAKAVRAAAARNVPGCTNPGLADPFAVVAAAVNDSVASGAMDDTLWDSGLLLAANDPGHNDGYNNAQPDVWGSGLAVTLGVGTVAQRAKISATLAANHTKMFKWGQARELPWPMCWQWSSPMPKYMNPNQCSEDGSGGWCGKVPCGSYQNGGYWATPLGWLYPAVAQANFTVAAGLLQDVLADFKAHGINEAVNHDFVYNPPQPVGPKVYTGVMGYLASAASVYAAIWQPAAPPPPPPSPPPPNPPKTCPCGPSACAPPAANPVGGKGLNLTGWWTGTWNGGTYKYPVVEHANHTVRFCSQLAADCWWEAVGVHNLTDSSLTLDFHRCSPYKDVAKQFHVFTDDSTIVDPDDPSQKYTRSPPPHH